jgi:hypothetical protein
MPGRSAAPVGPQSAEGYLSSCLDHKKLAEVAMGTYVDGGNPAVTRRSLQIYNGFKVPLVIAPYVERFTPDGVGQNFTSPVIKALDKPLLTLKSDAASIEVGQLMVLRTLSTGSLVAAFVVPAEPTKDAPIPGLITVLTDDALPPNYLAAPVNVVDVDKVPPGSTRTLVGAGELEVPKESNPSESRTLVILHEQLWRPATTSFPIAPYEEKRVVLVQTTGVSDTSTREDTIATTLGLGLSAGWGPISASISASFSSSSRTSHSQTISSLNQISTELKIRNGSSDALVIYWELVDIYSLIWAGGTKIQGTVETVQAPSLVRVYPKGALQPWDPPPPAR